MFFSFLFFHFFFLSLITKMVFYFSISALFNISRSIKTKYFFKDLATHDFFFFLPWWLFVSYSGLPEFKKKNNIFLYQTQSPIFYFIFLLSRPYVIFSFILRGVVANVLDYGIVVSQFEFKSCYYAHNFVPFYSTIYFCSSVLNFLIGIYNISISEFILSLLIGTFYLIL